MSVLEKATRILDLVAESSEPATLTSVAQQLGQPRSSTHRLLSELVDLGLLLRVGSAMYIPGPRLARWGTSTRDVGDIISVARPVMVRLRDEVGESVHLYVRQRDKRICVLAAEGNYELRHFTEVGKPLPLSVGASGKLLLAYAEQPIQSQELRRVAAEQITSPAPDAAELATQLVTVRETEWAMSFGEREEGLAAAAVPIRDGSGTVHAALSISGPTARLSSTRLEALRSKLVEAAAQISAAQGWQAGTRAPSWPAQRTPRRLSRAAAAS